MSAARSDRVTGALDWSEAAVLVTGGTGSFGNRLLSLPIVLGMSHADVEDVVAALWKVLGHYKG